MRREVGYRIAEVEERRTASADRKETLPSGRSLSQALLGGRSPGLSRDRRRSTRSDGSECRVIAEVKRRSPSAGALREDLDPTLLARSYAAAGAAAISVVTEPVRFGGSLADLEAVARAVEIPVLRKDFLLHEAQIQEAREAGADAVLLIVRLLEPSRLDNLMDCAKEVGVEALVEVHDLAELAQALAAGAALVGVNNRDLATLATDVSHSVQLAAAAREQGLGWPAVAVSESGIQTRAEVLEIGRAGYHGVLVGERLLRAADPAAALAELLGSGPP